MKQLPPPPSKPRTPRPPGTMPPQTRRVSRTLLSIEPADHHRYYLPPLPKEVTDKKNKLIEAIGELVKEHGFDFQTSSLTWKVHTVNEEKDPEYEHRMAEWTRKQEKYLKDSETYPAKLETYKQQLLKYKLKHQEKLEEEISQLLAAVEPPSAPTTSN